MKLRDFALLYTKARILSWITTSSQPVCIVTSAMDRVVIAEFVNGRMLEDTLPMFPDGVPTEWKEQGSSE